MTDDVVYPSVELILDLHVQIVEEGDHTEPGVRSEDAIQSALQYVSEAGLESLLWLNLVQYANLEQFATFADELLERSAKTVITMEMSVDATRGESRRVWDGTEFFSEHRLPEHVVMEELFLGGRDLMQF